MEDSTKLAAAVPQRYELERVDAVVRRTGLSQSGLYSAVAKGLFPRPMKIAAKAVAWRTDEVDEWIASRPRATAGRAPKRRATEPAAA